MWRANSSRHRAGHIWTKFECSVELLLNEETRSVKNKPAFDRMFLSSSWMRYKIRRKRLRLVSQLLLVFSISVLPIILRLVAAASRKDNDSSGWEASNKQRLSRTTISSIPSMIRFFARVSLMTTDAVGMANRATAEPSCLFNTPIQEKIDVLLKWCFGFLQSHSSSSLDKIKTDRQKTRECLPMSDVVHHVRVYRSLHG